MTDAEIVQQTINQDKNAYAELVRRYERQILVYLLRLLNFHHQDAEDVLAETFLKAYVNLASFNPKLKFSSWLYRIAHNEAVNLIKKKSKIYSVDIDQVEIPANFDFDQPRAEDLEKILSRLPVDDRNILTLFYLEEKSQREISDILKITENNVAVKISRAKQKAKKLINPQK